MGTNEELAVQAKEGDGAALLELWECVRRLCFRIAQRYMGMLAWAGHTSEDAEQLCFLGFWAAVQAFDPESGYQFTTYLSRPVMNVLRRTLGLRDGKELPPAPVSLDEQLTNEQDSDTRAALVPDRAAAEAFEAAEDHIHNEQLHAALEECLATLAQPQADVIRGMFFDGLTAKQIGESLGVSGARVGQLKQEGLRKLKRGKNLQRLQQFRDEIIPKPGMVRGSVPGRIAALMQLEARIK